MISEILKPDYLLAMCGCSNQLFCRGSELSILKSIVNNLSVAIAARSGESAGVMRERNVHRATRDTRLSYARNGMGDTDHTTLLSNNNFCE